MAFEVVDGDFVADGAQDAVAVFGEQQVALSVHRPEEVAELVVELHLGRDAGVHGAVPAVNKRLLAEILGGKLFSKKKYFKLRMFLF